MPFDLIQKKGAKSSSRNKKVCSEDNADGCILKIK